MKTQRRINARPDARRSFLPAPSVPSVFTIEITTACNNYCSGCANVELSRTRSGRKSTLAYMTRWKEVLNRVAALKSPNTIVRFSGGEPTLHPDFIEILKYADALHLPFAVLSTGRWGRKSTAALISTLHSCPNFLGLLVSLHGDEPGTHGAFVGGGKMVFEETCHNIQTVSNAGLRVFTNTVITNLNFDKIESIVSFSEQLGAQFAVFNRFIGPGHPLLPFDEQLRDAIRIIVLLQDAGKRCRVGNALPKCFFPHNAYPAPAGYELCHISPSGKMRPDNFSHFSFGNIFEQNIESIWQSEAAVYYRDHFPASCQDCAAFSACRGGLKSLNLESIRPMGDPLMQSPLSFEQIRFLNDDKSKNDPVMLALTSD